ILAHVAPGADAFPLEKPAEEIGTRLAALAARLREATGADLAPFLSPGFEGAALRPTHEAVDSPGPSLAIFRGEGFSATTVSAAAFREGWTRLLAPFARIDTAELDVL